MSEIFRNDKYDEFMKQYHKDHDVCPKCGSQSIKTTLMAFILNIDDKKSYKDKNRIECMDCGYRGIYHDLISEEQFKNK